ncbi:hypothetical protein COJ85_03490 [Bacillus sp. AFS076308]|uniref:DUF3231 family protein n=1 Tax=unclassified Bacillus (in: firmicutes) TaxID=185979 RepID=UPI000BF2EBB4|nr:MULTISPECIES: DUF3231 family protein [unclassified Bacillus (in: firmicutes)]PFO08319.1 hypothetical protein COJ85_03490 [Bacillus sp. AFS076308]PGV50671.1 hypothetical protein COD92_17200 [Bacillus sp. AFS037270]
MDDKLRLTSSEIGTLWAEYVNGTMTDVVNRYMVTIIDDEAIKAIFQDAIKTFEKQKQQIVIFMESEGFPIPNGFTESDLYKCKQRLFTDIFCLNYLHIMSLHGLLGHTTSIGVSVRKDLRDFYDSCDNDAKRMYHQTIELLLEKGNFQRDPLFYPAKTPEYVSSKDFIDGFFGKGRKLAATEMISISINIKKSIMAKTLSIAFSQVAQSKEIRKFLTKSEKTADQQIKVLTKLMQADNLPVPKSWETEVTTSTESPFSDKLMLYHTGFLFQAAQNYHGAGLASAMRTDLVTAYEGTILENLIITKKWFDLMVENKWLEQPPLAPNRQEIAKEM